ncbi:hypothetical protein C8N42_12920, partial [Celeribacter persicus]
AARREKVDDFYAARTVNTTALPWSNFAPPFSSVTVFMANWDGSWPFSSSAMSPWLCYMKSSGGMAHCAGWRDAPDRPPPAKRNFVRFRKQGPLRPCPGLSGTPVTQHMLRPTLILQNGNTKDASGVTGALFPQAAFHREPKDRDERTRCRRTPFVTLRDFRLASQTVTGISLRKPWT